MQITTENFRKVEISSQDQLRNWLLKHHTQDESVWLVTYKKGNDGKYVSTDQVLDELLCFGWIDGIRRKLDNEQTMQLISPRKTQHWSKTYKDRAAKLIDANLMHESGFRSIEVAKENGMWNFLDDVDQLIKPDDLSIAFSKKKEAEAFSMRSMIPVSDLFYAGSNWPKQTRHEKAGLRKSWNYQQKEKSFLVAKTIII